MALLVLAAACNNSTESATGKSTDTAADSTQKHELVKRWETDTLVKVPESVLVDDANQVLYVSEIDGEPWAADGKGEIAKIGFDGTIINTDWVTGLSAPKGMGIVNGKLYVADITQVAVIDIASGKIEKKIAVPGSENLNDITVNGNGVVYISDSKANKVFQISEDKPALYLDSLQGPNGLCAKGGDLYLVQMGTGGFYKVGADKSLTKIADGMEGGTDGLVNVSGDDFLVSCWSGTIWYIKADGTKTLLLDTTKEQKNTADIGYDPATKTVYVPTFFKKSVMAYEVK